MDGRARLDARDRSHFARLRERFLGRRRSYVVDAGYQLRSEIVAVLGMAFLLVFAAALFHLLSQENARLWRSNDSRSIEDSRFGVLETLEPFAGLGV